MQYSVKIFPRTYFRENIYVKIFLWKYFHRNILVEICLWKYFPAKKKRSLDCTKIQKFQIPEKTAISGAWKLGGDIDDTNYTAEITDFRQIAIINHAY